MLVALDLRPGLVSIGTILPAIKTQFALLHTTAALLDSVSDLLLSLLTLPTTWLAALPRRHHHHCGPGLLGVVTAVRALAPGAAGLLLATA